MADRRHLLPVERNAGGERGGEQVRQRDHQLVGIAFRALDVEEAFAAGRRPPLLMTTIAVGMRLCLVTMPWMTRGHLSGAAAGARGQR